MAGWTSLSGYLHYKPGSSSSSSFTLGRLKAKKRMWFVLEESQCQLLFFKSEDDAGRKQPQGLINLKGAAITLDLDNQNQFIIIVDGKDHILTAENHESMMIWLMALQAKRDHFSKRAADMDETLEAVDFDDKRVRSSSDLSKSQQIMRSHKTLCATKSLHSNMGKPLPAALTCDDVRTADWKHYQLSRLGETIDSPRVRKEVTPRVNHQPYNKQLSVSAEHAAGMQLYLQQKTTVVQPNQCSNSSSGSTGDSDEVFGEDGHLAPPKEESWRTKILRKLNLEDDKDKYHDEQFTPRKSTRSLSVSLSSDSAIDKAEITSPEQNGRVFGLEKELIATKCELARVMNKQTCYNEILKQKDEIISDLDDKLCKISPNDQPYDSKRRVKTVASNELHERVRVLQNQNRFLNEEVRRLARLRGDDASKFTDQDFHLLSLEGEIEKWKFDYVSLIQSSIRFSGTDSMDDAELILFGGNRHKKRILQLLEDARKVNPSLPTYERLANKEVHVDAYGFKHSFEDNGLLLHYLCQELSQHFITQAGSYEEHQKRWVLYIGQNNKGILKDKPTLKQLVRGGIPDQYRKQMWRQLVYHQVQDIITEKGPHYYRNLCNMLPDSPLAARYRKQISLDLMRTMPSNVKFATSGSRGIMDLQDVLLAFCIHSPDIGYCQGMNFIVGMALLFMDAHDAFWTLVAVTERYFTSNYFDHNLVGAQADQAVLKDIVTEKLSTTSKHLDAIDIEISTVTLNWFLAIYFDAVPFMTLLRIWDCFLLEGPKVLFRFCLAILKMNEREILMKNDTISVMRHLKSCAKITYDIEGLVKIAFEDLRPFPHRQAIKSKQAFYLTSLKEKYKRRELQKMAFAEREQMFMALEAEAGSFLTFECCTASPSGEIWLCYGEQNQSHVCRVNAKDGVMLDISLEFDSKMMCMLAIPNNIVIYGSISWLLYSYDMAKNTERWHIRLHDAVLSVCSFSDDDEQFRIFAGLADGTVAIIENGESAIAPVDVMYIPVGQSPVTCVRVLGKQLWCACGNTVYVIHAGTLDAMDNFTVSSNPYDHILSLEPSVPGVLISVRGSSILELWDPQTLSCKMLYDTRSGRYPNLRKEDDAYFNRARITSILSYENTVWVGTGEGNLMIYDIVETGSCKTPSEQSFNGSLAENLCLVNDDNDPIRKVEEKVRDLYYRKLNEGLNISPVKQDSKVENPDTKISSPIDISNIKSEEFVTNSVGSTVFVNNAEEMNRNRIMASTPLSSPEKRYVGNATNPTESEFHSSQGSFWFDSCGDSFTQSCQHGHEKCTEPHSAEMAAKSRRRLFDPTSSQDMGLCNGHLMEESEGSTVNEDSGPKLPKDVFPENHIPNKSDLLSMYVLTQSKSVQDKKDKKMNKSLDNGSTEIKSSDENKSQSFDVIELPESSNSSLVVIDSDSSPEKAKKSERSDSLNKGSNMSTINENEMNNSYNSMTQKTESEMSSGGVTMGFAVDSGHVSDISESTTNHFSSKSAINKDTTNNTSDFKCNKCANNSVQNDNVICTCSKPTANGHVNKFISVQNSVPEKDCQSCKAKKCSCRKTDNSLTQCGQCANCKNGNVCTSSSGSGTATDGSSRTASRHSTSDDSQHFQSIESEQDEVFMDATSSPFRSESSLVENPKREPQTPVRKITRADLFKDNYASYDSSSAYQSAQENMTPNRSSVSSDLSGRAVLDSTSKPEKFQPKNREAQYRIDFTNIQVDTDVESNVSFNLHGSLSSEADFKQVDDFLQQKSGLSGIDPASLIFPEDFNISSFEQSEDKGNAFGTSGSFSTSKSLHGWSSYDEISTPSRVDSVKGVQRPNMLRVNSVQSNMSAATSIISGTTMSESLYTADLFLQAKVKISDKPVKCLLKDSSFGETIMLSMSGSYGDDEAVLKWKKEPNEQMWTNEPILEICPETKVAKLPNYMRRLSLMSSSLSSSEHSALVNFKKMNMSQ